jgi:adenylylsulfate kinase-like enzyme
MGNIFQKLIPGNEPKRVLFLGLDAAGKTTVAKFLLLLHHFFV